MVLSKTSPTAPAITLYGIPNCDQVKKARQWLEVQHLPYQFHDFKKAGLSQKLIETWFRRRRWDELLNRKGTTWRKLAIDQQPADQIAAVALMLAQPSVIKRPVLELPNVLEIGFSAERYADIFALVSAPNATQK
jgi:arsenate reductase